MYNYPPDYSEQMQIPVTNPDIEIEVIGNKFHAEYKGKAFYLGDDVDFLKYRLENSIPDHIEDDEALNLWSQEVIAKFQKQLDELIGETKQLYYKMRELLPNFDSVVQEESILTIAKLNKMYILLRYQKRDKDTSVAA